jgi:hypothetical protein
MTRKYEKSSKKKFEKKFKKGSKKGLKKSLLKKFKNITNCRREGRELRGGPGWCGVGRVENCHSNA